MKKSLFPERKKSAHELRNRVIRQMKKTYPMTSREIRRRVESELDDIVDCEFQHIFLLTKEWLDMTGLEPSDITFGGGIGYDCIISYLMGITDMDPIDFATYSERCQFSSMNEHDAYFEIWIPESMKNKAVNKLRKLPGIGEVIIQNNDIFYLVPEEKKAEDHTEDLPVPFIKLIIHGDKNLDIIRNVRKMIVPKDIAFTQKQLDEGVKWITKTATSDEEKNLSAFHRIPVLRNPHIAERIARLSGDPPMDLYDLALLVNGTIGSGDSTYPELLGRTLIATRMAYCRSMYPDEFDRAYVNRIGTDRRYKVEGFNTHRQRGSAKTRYRELLNGIGKAVIGNDELVDALALAITSSDVSWSDSPLDVERYPRQSLLIVGGTGTGKTFTVKTAAKVSGRAFVNINLAEISAVGYSGKDLATAIGTAVRGIDSNRLQSAIYFMDELDKVILGEKMRNTERTFDLVPELLKMVEENELMLKTGENSYTRIPTQNAIFVFAGAFEDVNKIILERIKYNRSIGFSTSEGGPDGAVTHSKNDDIILTELQSEDLENYGVSRQLLGRMSRIVITRPMNTEGYKNILLRSSDSALAKHIRLTSEVYGVDMIVTEEAVNAIASECERKRVGARGLNSIVNTVVTRSLADALKRDDVSTMVMVVDGDGNVKCELEYESHFT